jgi:hypothetical protein
MMNSYSNEADFAFAIEDRNDKFFHNGEQP